VAKSVEVLRLTGWPAGLQPSQTPHPQAEAALLRLCKDFVATSAPTVLVCQYRDPKMVNVNDLSDICELKRWGDDFRAVHGTRVCL